MTMKFLFGGVDNMHDPGQLDGDEGVTVKQVCADNTDISDDFGGRRRLGRTLVQAGRYHSGWCTFDETFAMLIKDSILYQLNADGTTTVLNVLTSNNRACYTEVNNAIFFSNGIQEDTGVIQNGQWYDLGDTTDRFKETTPAANHATFYRGSIYGALGSVITATEPYNMEVVDRRLSKIPIPGAVRMLQAVKNGIWLSTGKEIIFLSGTDLETFEYLPKAKYPAIPYAYTYADGEEIPGVDLTGKVAVFGTTRGICIGSGDGQLINLSQERASFNGGVEGSIILIKRDGQTHIVLSTDGSIAADNPYVPKVIDVLTPSLDFSDPDNSQYITLVT